MSYVLPVQVDITGHIYTGARPSHGWSTINCESRDHALQIMRDYPQARMPCWRRIERDEI